VFEGINKAESSSYFNLTLVKLKLAMCIVQMYAYGRNIYMELALRPIVQISSLKCVNATYYG
jgi:hypothetical protein